MLVLKQIRISPEIDLLCYQSATPAKKVAAKLEEFRGVVLPELIGGMCWPTVGGGVCKPLA